jgi:hypothetical protein
MNAKNRLQQYNTRHKKKRKTTLKWTDKVEEDLNIKGEKKAVSGHRQW